MTSVQIHGASEDRYGLVFFRQQEDQEKALSVSKGKLFFGMLIEVTAWNGPGTCRLPVFTPQPSIDGLRCIVMALPGGHAGGRAAYQRLITP